MAKVTTDKYSNKAYGLVTMSAANTLTYGQIQMGVGLFEGRALVIHRLSWFPTSDLFREIVVAADSMHYALTTSNRITDIQDVSDPAIVYKGAIIGRAAAVELAHAPIVADFTGLPGGGRLVPANPLWVALTTGGCANAHTIRLMMDFTFVELSAQDYLEVIQSMFPANII